MTAWDFASKLLDIICRPGLADKAIGALLLVLVVLIAMEALPIQKKPLTEIARSLGHALNAEELDRISILEKKSIKEEKDNVRTQMLILLSDYPENTSEILEVARHYFHDIQGDWYMTSLFDDWLTKYGHGQPEWFNKLA